MSASLYFVSENGSEKKYFNTDFNVSNANARHILSALGFNPHFEESDFINIDEFILSIERYFSSELGTLIDKGKPAKEISGPSGAKIIDCGRRDGYLEDKFTILLHLAKENKEKEGGALCYFA